MANPVMLAAVLNIVIWAVAFLGLTALVLLSFRPEKVHLLGRCSAIIIAGCRLVVALASLRFIDSNAHLVAVAGWFVWEVAGVLAIQAKDKLLATCSRASENWRLAEELRRIMLRLSASRKVNVQQLLQNNRPNTATIGRARNGLRLRFHAQEVLEALATFWYAISERSNDNPGFGRNFRVGLYLERDGALAPIAGYDYMRRSPEPFRAPYEFSDRFRLDQVHDQPALVVRCVLEQRTLIETDCQNSTGFAYYRANQESYLRSMIAKPLFRFLLVDGQGVRGALAIDTNIAGFFREDDSEWYEQVLEQFIALIDLELHIAYLLGEQI